MAIYDQIKDCPCVRQPLDSVPDRRILVFEYLAHHLLDFAQQDIGIKQTKIVLWSVLRALAALHERNIVHTGRRYSSAANYSTADRN